MLITLFCSKHSPPTAFIPANSQMVMQSPSSNSKNPLMRPAFNMKSPKCQAPSQFSPALMQCLPFCKLYNSFFAPSRLSSPPFPPGLRLLSPRKCPEVNQNTGSDALAGTKRRLDEDMGLLNTETMPSSTADQNITSGLADARQHQQHRSATGKIESAPKRTIREVGAQSRKEHTSAFDLVDDALHISSDDEFEISALTWQFSGKKLNVMVLFSMVGRTYATMLRDVQHWSVYYNQSFDIAIVSTIFNVCEKKHLWLKAAVIHQLCLVCSEVRLLQALPSKRTKQVVPEARSHLKWPGKKK
jgi:hypothetical protein